MTLPTALIVGVGPGLGLALARVFASNGYGVVAAARHATALDFGQGAEETRDAEIIPFDCDATVPADVDRLFARIAELRAPLEVAVYNAGAFAPTRVTDIEPEEFERCWRVGCFGGFLVGRAAARVMLGHGKGGTILFTGATASLRGGAGFANLASPKFALRALAQSMARELGPLGIHVAHVIIDGQIRSARYEHLLEQRGPDSLLEPRAIAETYLALARQHCSAWTHELDLRPWSEKF